MKERASAPREDSGYLRIDESDRCAHLVEAADWLEVVPHGVVVQVRASRDAVEPGAEESEVHDGGIRLSRIGQFPARGFAVPHRAFDFVSGKLVALRLLHGEGSPLVDAGSR